MGGVDVKRLLRRVWPVLLLAPFALSGSGAWAAGCKLENIEMPVRIVDHRPIASLKLNGVEVAMLVDSGAFYSFLSASTSEQLKLKTRPLPHGLRIEGNTGRIEARMTRVEKTELLGAVLTDVEFIVGGNEMNAGIGGILGRNVLSAGDTEYDLAHGVVRLSFPKGDCDNTDLAYWAGKAPVVVVPLELESGVRSDTAIHVNALINGESTLALMDTGAPSTTLTLNAARRAGMKESDLVPLGRVGGAGEGRVNVWSGRVGTFEIGGEKISNNRVHVKDTDRAAHGVLLGLDYFLSHRIYVSRLQRQVYITWNGGPVFLQDSGKPGEYDPRYAALPNDVAEGDADALARRGAAALAAGNLARALEDLDRAVTLAPNVADYVFTRARIRQAMRQPRLALFDLDDALRLDPALSEARLRRVRTREALKDRPGALADLAELDASSPPSSALRADMAEMYADFAQVPDALRQFELWMKSHSKDARMAGVLGERCWMRARLNIELPSALEDCKEAVDRDEGEPRHRDSLGWTYLRLGDPVKAKRAFDDAIKLKELPFSLYGRAVAQLRLKDIASAERDLASARKLRPGIDMAVRREGFEFAEIADPPKASPAAAPEPPGDDARQ